MNGRIDVFSKYKKKANDRFGYVFLDDQKYPIMCSKMCFEGRILIAFCENRGDHVEIDDLRKINLEDDEQEKGFLEFLLIYDTKKKSLLFKEILDLDDREEFKEDPNKLFQISPNGQVLAMRS